jgi:hypothetical protein
MYIEDKSESLTGPCRIGRVVFSKTGATLTYAGRSFQSLKGSGFKANYFDIETGDQFWISGPRRDGADGLYGRMIQPADVDDDVAEEYWRDIRGRGARAPSSTPMENPWLAVSTEAPAPTNKVEVTHGSSRSSISERKS